MIKRSPGGVVAGSLGRAAGYIACAGLATSALGANIVWEGGIAGDYMTPSNWAGDMIPGFSDTLVLDTTPFMQINFTKSVTNGRLLHADGDLILDLNGNTLDLRVASSITESWTSGVGVANGGQVDINGGRVICNYAGVANSIGDRSTIILDDPAAAFETRDSARVGAFGDGGIGISNAASLVVGNDLVIGETAFGDGVVVLSDAGSSAIVSDQIQVGALGDGVLRINSEALVMCQEFFVAAFEFSVGDVIIGGTGALLDIAGASGVGFAGFGEVEINAGGKFTAQQLRVGFAPLSNGIIRVQGANAMLEIDADVLVGGNGAGQILIQNGGQAHLGELSLTSSADMAMATVTGPTSRLDLNDELRVGSIGAGLLEVLDEANVTADDIEINPGGLLKMDRAHIAFTNMIIASAGVGQERARGEDPPPTGLEGNGDLAGNITCRGRLAPGPDFTTIPLNGSITFEETADLELQFRMPGIGGEMSDGLAVTGDVVLGGTLHMERDGAVSPFLLQRVPIITGAASISGRFDDAVIDQPVVNEFRLIIVENGTDVELVATVLGDVTGDGMIDTFDLADLLAAWGTSEPNSDFTDDGVVDTFDLAVMLAAWGG